MSNAAVNPLATHADENAHGHDGHAAGHNPHLAHHFDTPEQQYTSAKLGMWVFLGTEILMFGGLFCGYAVYRHAHPDVFEFAHHSLNKWLGAINTLVLITSSLTMAWGVRAAQLGHQASLRWLLAVTILGGYIFLGIKSVEYRTKWEHHLFIGSDNKYRTEESLREAVKEAKEEAGPAPLAAPMAPASAAGLPAEVRSTDNVALLPPDPNKGSADEAKIRPPFVDSTGLAPGAASAPPVEQTAEDLSKFDQKRLYTFFAVYFFMTGLHGLHVVIGMSLIVWVLLRSVGPRNIPWAVPMIPGSIGLFLAVVGVIIAGEAGKWLIVGGLILAVLSVIWALLWAPLRRKRSAESEFGPAYFTPVDLVGLYWHLVDLIWIFLFPLLYLIH